MAKKIWNAEEKLQYERALQAKGFQYIAGVDEVGRGPLAGPVCAAAVILPFGLEIPGLTDSKKLTEKKREKLYDEIIEKAAAFGIAQATQEEIDEIIKLDEEQNNPPLTWEELKGMEGKPIWIEVKYHNPEAIYKYWTIVKYFNSHEGGDMVFTGTGFYHKDLLGIDWQAYRKERNGKKCILQTTESFRQM